MNRFQIILSIVCGVALIVAIMMFSGFIPSPSSSSKAPDTGAVVIWGTLPQGDFGQIADALSKKDKTLALRYIQIAPDQLKDMLTEALADNNQPDILLYPNDILVSLEPRITPIPYTAFPESAFKQTYTELTEGLLTSGGLLGIPVGSDPLMLYYNRDILSDAGFAQPIQYWDDVALYVEKIRIKTIGTTITRAAFGMGLYDNVSNAKALLATLLLQAGNPIVERVVSNDGYTYKPNLAYATDVNGVSIAESIVSFYTRFANPYDDFYTWNRSLVNSREAFLAGDLAYYIGFASELLNLRERNPNLNFAPSMMPQIKNTGNKTTFARLYVMSPVKNAINPTGATKVLTMFTDPQMTKLLDSLYVLSPVHRSVIADTSDVKGYTTLFYEQALIAKTWFDPSPAQSDAVFRDMINGVITGRMKISEAVIRAQGLLGASN